MKIRSRAGGSRSLRWGEGEAREDVQFNADGIAECTKKTGEALCAAFPDSYSPVRPKTSKKKEA
jgi:hypothetical protein